MHDRRPTVDDSPLQHYFLSSMVFDRQNTLGIEQLLPEEIAYLRIWELDQAIKVSTFMSYFISDSGDHALTTLEVLRRCGAAESARIFEEAIKCLETCEGFTPDRSVRCNRIDKAADLETDFTRLTESYRQANEPVCNMALEHAYQAYCRAGIRMAKYHKGGYDIGPLWHQPDAFILQWRGKPLGTITISMSDQPWVGGSYSPSDDAAEFRAFFDAWFEHGTLVWDAPGFAPDLSDERKWSVVAREDDVVMSISVPLVEWERNRISWRWRNW